MATTYVKKGNEVQKISGDQWEEFKQAGYVAITKSQYDSIKDGKKDSNDQRFFNRRSFQRSSK